MIFTRCLIPPRKKATARSPAERTVWSNRNPALPFQTSLSFPFRVWDRFFGRLSPWNRESQIHDPSLSQGPPLLLKRLGTMTSTPSRRLAQNVPQLRHHISTLPWRASASMREPQQRRNWSGLFRRSIRASQRSWLISCQRRSIGSSFLMVAISLSTTWTGSKRSSPQALGKRGTCRANRLTVFE